MPVPVCALRLRSLRPRSAALVLHSFRVACFSWALFCIACLRVSFFCNTHNEHVRNAQQSNVTGTDQDC